MSRVFITGSTEGLGRAAAETLIGQGHRLVLHARNPARAADLAPLAERIDGIVVGDLSSAVETREVARQVNAIGRMDAVIHNAGVYTPPERGATPEGHSTLLAVNTLAPWLLTALIQRPDRLVFLSSGLHRGGEGPLDDIDWTERPWDAARAYAESKLHMATLPAILTAAWPGVVSSAVDPGWVRTRMGGSSAPLDLDAGQRTQSWLAVTDDPAAQASGGYWRDRRREEPAAQAGDPAFQAALAERLADLTGVALR